MTDEEMRGAYVLARSYRQDAVLEGARAKMLPAAPEREQLNAEVARWARYADEHEARAAELEATHANSSARPPWPRRGAEPSEELRWAWHDLEQARRQVAEPGRHTDGARLREVHQRVNVLEAHEGRSDTELGAAEIGDRRAAEALRHILSRP